MIGALVVGGRASILGGSVVRGASTIWVRRRRIRIRK
jgi:hypothetical protein